MGTEIHRMPHILRLGQNLPDDVAAPVIGIGELLFTFPESLVLLAEVDSRRVDLIVKEDTGEYTYNAETMPGIGASLTETIALTVYLKDTAYTGVTMKVGDTELTGTADEATQTVKFEGFWATDLYNEITLTFTGAEGTESLEATTSLVQYLNRYAGDETYAKVATATAQYLYAARNFCLKNRTNA